MTTPHLLYSIRRIRKPGMLAFLVFAFTCINAQTPDSWTRKSDFPGTARQDAAAFTAGGKGYIVSGKDSSGTLLNEVWMYDAANDSWTRKNDFPGVSRCGAAAFSVSDTGYVTCGYDGTDELKDCWKYNHGTDTWTRMQDVGTSLSGTFNGRSHATGLSTSNYGYLLCGYDGSPGYLKQNMRFDPQNDTNWAVARNMGNVSELTLFGRRWGAGFVIGNTPYFGTGFTFSQDIRKDIWRYDAALASWVQMTDLPDIRSNAFGFALYGKGYIGCGTNGSSQQDLWRFNPADNSWTQVSDLPGGSRVNASCFVIGNRAYVSGGQHTAGTVYNDLWEYTPDSTVGVAESLVPDFNVFLRDGQILLTCTSANIIGATFELYSLNGVLLRKEVVKGSVTRLSTIELAASTYLYSVIDPKQRWGKTGKICLD
ncbi:MAG: Kelch repeat-containing protein [Bacteroidota bacterium]